jgi:hypothetical protein
MECVPEISTVLRAELQFSAFHQDPLLTSLFISV